ncbi:MAG: hypothetical protein OK422_03780 [Thaumarchaeota archaeon]|nr:hypothetical protein [Nitrososphaerota archaeon]
MAVPLDEQILGLYKELYPSEAYLMGFREYAGKVFIPTRKSLSTGLRKIKALRRGAKTDLQKKVLDAIEVNFRLEEPQPVLDNILGTIFVHLAKEGVHEKHVLSLLRNSSKAIDATAVRFSKKQIPVGVKALTLYRLGGIVSILDAVKKEAKTIELKSECDALKKKAAEFVTMFKLDGFGQGRFDEVERVFKKYGFDMGRKKFYDYALKRGFDYHETPEELEKKAISWIDEEQSKFRAIIAKLAKFYNCKPTVEAVTKAVDSRIPFKTRELLKVTKTIRRVVRRLVNEDLVRINPKYNTRVIETPSYLTGTIPTGAAQFFDTFTRRPFQVYFQTTDPKRDPDRSVSSLLDLLVHEEYGHCVHHSNSSLGFMGRVNPVQLLPTLLSGPITEGLSFNREREFMDVVKSLERKKRLTKAEKDYVELMGKYGGLKLTNLEVEFQTRRWRMVRFLRVVGDVRINTGKQGLLEFLDWAHEYTGVARATAYYQLFPAHEGIFPGYATAYAVVGQEIMAIEKGIRDDKKRVKFSTYLCSIGYPPRSAYRRLLQDYAKKLRKEKR